MPAYRTFRPPHLLSEAMRDFLHTQAGDDFTSLTQLFPATWTAVVMGGLLRDLLLDRLLGIKAKPADMDIVIFGADSVGEIKSKLRKTTHSTNAFGGVKCQLRGKGITFDIWRVEDHPNMVMAPKPHTIEQLLRHNLLDVDAMLWDPATDCLHDGGCLKSIRVRRIGLAGAEGISDEFPASQVAHVLVIAFKTGFTVSEEVRSFVANASARCRTVDVEKTLERKFPEDAAQIESFWNDLLSGGIQRCPAPTRAASL
jgi:hypothetical protein